jgi:glutamyl-tRNA synthetase
MLLFQALDLPVPRYAHMPLILALGGGKLSKRYGSMSVTEYRAKGYLPEAMINFLARMGWSFDDKQEIFSLQELIEKFSLEGVSKSGAVYDLQKLNHLGAYYIRQRPLEDILALAVPYLVRAGLVSGAEASPQGPQRPRIARMVELEQGRIEHLAQVVDKLRYYFEDPQAPDEGAAKVLQKKSEALALVQRYSQGLGDRFPGAGWGLQDQGLLDQHARQFAAREEVQLGDLAQPVRALLTGRSATPGLFEVMAVLGKEACMRRLAKAAEWFARAAREKA